LTGSTWSEIRSGITDYKQRVAVARVESLVRECFATNCGASTLEKLRDGFETLPESFRHLLPRNTDNDSVLRLWATTMALEFIPEDRP
jgi:hypothetical protein